VLVSSHLLAEVAQTVDDIVIIDGVPSRPVREAWNKDPQVRRGARGEI
jgi:hypothetical protein